MGYESFLRATRIRYLAIASIFIGAVLLTSCADSDSRHSTQRAGYTPNLIAFVGQRLSIEPVPPRIGELPFNSEFRVRVKVLEVVYGKYEEKEMEFSSFVHVGSPAFASSEFGLVYVSLKGWEYVHQKYLFQHVFSTSDGRWAGCGDPYGGITKSHHHGVKAVPMSFDPPVTFDLSNRNARDISERFPAPYFEIQGNTATCVMGSYPADLFRVMAEGYLRARGVFGPPFKDLEDAPPPIWEQWTPFCLSPMNTPVREILCIMRARRSGA